MSNRRRCPQCHCSTNVIKSGITSASRQRYKCKDCDITWANKARPKRLECKIWHDFAIKGIKLRWLSERHGLSKNKLREILVRHEVSPIIPKHPERVSVVGMDVTYFGKRGINAWGLLIVIDLHTGECLYCEEIPGHEHYGHYIAAISYLETLGVHPKACVIDGVPGLAGALELKGFLVQHCQYHQIRSVTSYLTRKPVLEPNIELRNLALSLSYTKRQNFITAFNQWHYKHHVWLKERTINPETGEFEYAHQKTRSAVNSIRRSFPYLFTFEQHPELKIPNTNNYMEGINSTIKAALISHRGIKKTLKIKIIRNLLSVRTGAENNTKK